MQQGAHAIGQLRYAHHPMTDWRVVKRPLRRPLHDAHLAPNMGPDQVMAKGGTEPLFRENDSRARIEFGSRLDPQRQTKQQIAQIDALLHVVGL